MDSKTTNSRMRRLARGFTLIELVVVVAVLAILAGLVLPKLDIFKLKSNKAVAAANIAGVNRFVESFRTQRDVYPDVWDSLIDDAAQTNLYPHLDPQLVGPVVSGIPASPTKLTTTTIASQNELRSLTRMGITSMLYHVAGGFEGNSATNAHTLAVGDTVATINAADPDGAAIISELYPSTGAVPAGRKLVVFGLGPRNQLCDNSDLSATLHAAPFYANTDQLKYYNRFLVIFEVSTGGSRAKFLASMGADADRLTEEIQDFYEN